MADEQQMLRDHQKTWHGFTRLMLWSIIGIVVTLIFLALVTL